MENISIAIFYVLYDWGAANEAAAVFTPFLWRTSLSPRCSSLCTHGRNAIVILMPGFTGSPVKQEAEGSLVYWDVCWPLLWPDVPVVLKTEDEDGITKPRSDAWQSLCSRMCTEGCRYLRWRTKGWVRDTHYSRWHDEAFISHSAGIHKNTTSSLQLVFSSSHRLFFPPFLVFCLIFSATLVSCLEGHVQSCAKLSPAATDWSPQRSSPFLTLITLQEKGFSDRGREGVIPRWLLAVPFNHTDW